MTDTYWWRLRKTPVLVYVEYGHAHARLHATDLKMQTGPPIAIGLNLEHNLKTRHTGTGTYIDAQELAAGKIRRLTRLELDDAHVLDGLRGHLKHADDITSPWRLIVTLRRKHDFTVEPEFRNDRTLVLRVAGP